jgi:hypothetical protein
VHTTIDQVVEVKVLLSTKHAWRARVCEKNNNDISRPAVRAGTWGFVKSLFRDGRFGRACMRQLVGS